jgi:hypothetical protein
MSLSQTVVATPATQASSRCLTPHAYPSPAVLSQALVELGYPISRYASAHPLPENLQRVFTRARRAYYQNRPEFESLSVLLRQGVAALPTAVLQKMVQLRTPFVPMWVGFVRGTEILATLA